MTDDREFPKQESLTAPRIVVVGLGGAGGNAVNNMIQSKLEGVEILVANTDAQALQQSLCERRIQIGQSVSQGLGAGSRPDVGRAATEEALEEILAEIKGANMVFITAGMGGGTGTGGAPVLARAAREAGILTVGVVTKPFHFEGVRRMRIAEAGIAELTQYVDTLIIIPNQNLFRIADKNTTFADAFKMADEVLCSGVRGVTDLMVMPGLVNLDFADIRSVMAEKGKAMMGTGEAEGDGRALQAAEAAISNPLLDEGTIKGARGVLINITGGPDMTLFEVDEASNRIREEVDPEANIIFGSTFDQGLEGRIRVSVVATDIEAERVERPQPATLGLVTSPAAEKPVPEPAEESRVADAEVVAETVAEVATEIVAEIATETVAETATETVAEIATETVAEIVAETATEQLTQDRPAEDGPKDRPEDGQQANDKTVAAVLFTGNGADSEEAGEQSPETGGEVDGEKEGRQGNYGVRYVVWDRRHETKIYTIAAIQTARIHNEPHAKKLKVFASLEDAKAAAGVILTRSMYEKESKGRFTYCTNKGRANLKYEIGKEVPNYFV